MGERSLSAENQSLRNLPVKFLVIKVNVAGYKKSMNINYSFYTSITRS